jgi:hypothetical protein
MTTNPNPKPNFNPNPNPNPLPVVDVDETVRVEIPLSVAKPVANPPLLTAVSRLVIRLDDSTPLVTVKRWVKNQG